MAGTPQEEMRLYLDASPQRVMSLWFIIASLLISPLFIAIVLAVSNLVVPSKPVKAQAKGEIVPTDRMPASPDLSKPEKAQAEDEIPIFGIVCSVLAVSGVVTAFFLIRWQRQKNSNLLNSNDAFSPSDLFRQTQTMWIAAMAIHEGLIIVSIVLGFVASSGETDKILCLSVAGALWVLALLTLLPTRRNIEKNLGLDGLARNYEWADFLLNRCGPSPAGFSHLRRVPALPGLAVQRSIWRTHPIRQVGAATSSTPTRRPSDPQRYKPRYGRHRKWWQRPCCWTRTPRCCAASSGPQPRDWQSPDCAGGFSGYHHIPGKPQAGYSLAQPQTNIRSGSPG